MREEAGLKGFFYGASLGSIRHRHKQQVPQAERALWQRCVARQGGRASSAQNAKTVRWAPTLLARHFSGTIPRITFRYTEMLSPRLGGGVVACAISLTSLRSNTRAARDRHSLFVRRAPTLASAGVA